MPKATDKQRAASLHVKRNFRGDWEIYGFDDPIGPYNTRQEASEDKRGVAAYYRNHHKRNFITTD